MSKPKNAADEQELDAALKATFPASDPVAIADDAPGSEPDRPLHRKPGKLDVALVEELARNVAHKHETDQHGK